MRNNKDTVKCRTCKIEYLKNNFPLGVSSKCKHCIEESAIVYITNGKPNDTPLDIISENKICSYCNQSKDIKDFAYENRRKCKECKRIQQKLWRQNNKDVFNEKQTEYRLRIKDRPEIKARNKRYYDKAYTNHPEIFRERNMKKYRTIEGNLNNKMSKSIRATLLDKNYKSWKAMVSYTTEELKSNIESKFTEGMNWEEFKKGNIHLDHILPKELFEFNSENDIQFKICWSLNNLQPLWGEDNLSKRDKLPNGVKASALSKENKLKYLRELGFNL